MVIERGEQIITFYQARESPKGPIRTWRINGAMASPKENYC